MEFGVSFFRNVIDKDASFQIKLIFINFKLYNSRYKLNTKKRFKST